MRPIAVRTPPTISTSPISTLLSDFSWLDVFLQDGEDINGDEFVSQRFRPNRPEEGAEKEVKFSFAANSAIMPERYFLAYQGGFEKH
jgi:hypothetical protein